MKELTKCYCGHTTTCDCGPEEPKQEKLEEAAKRYSYGGREGGHRTPFLEGVKWQQERSYSDMQEYAEFCIECDRKQMPLLLVQDWYEHYKNK